MTDARTDPASFRDPGNVVFTRDGHVYRALDGNAAAVARDALAGPAIRRLQARGRLVGTDVRDDVEPPPPARGAHWEMVVEHERVPVLTYPFEWSFSMLRAAGLCHLDVLLGALEDGFSLSDGSAYNVQFVGPRPMFIDLGSIVAADGPWAGYRQFCETVLNPLLLQAHLGVPFQPLLRASVDGIPSETAARLLGGRSLLRRGVARHVFLQAVAQRHITAGSEGMKTELAEAGFGREVAIGLARQLRKTIVGLTPRARRTTWDRYRVDCSYEDADRHAKHEVVRGAVAGASVDTVIDLGANDGEYSAIAAEHCRLVVAVDGDHNAVDRLWRTAVEDGRDNVLPLLVDLADPSPGIGWRNVERPPFEARVGGDLVLALALVHHLVIGRNIPAPMVVDWLAALAPDAVIEIPHRDDPMVELLLRDRPDAVGSAYSLDALLDCIGDRFDVGETVVLPSGTRTLVRASSGRDRS